MEVRSDVTFDPVEVSDRGAYTCTIFDSEDVIVLEVTVIFFVETGTPAI